MQASKEVWGKLFGTISTREKLLNHRLELAIHEWARMKANDSLECRNCHSAQSMDTTRQSPRAVEAHQRFLFTGQPTEKSKSLILLRKEAAKEGRNTRSTSLVSKASDQSPRAKRCP
jgi:hypothetical protein